MIVEIMPNRRCVSMSQSVPVINPTRVRIEQISHPTHPLSREDVIWMLDLIKKKVSEPDVNLIDLSSTQLLQHFHVFAELAMKLIHHRQTCYQETEQLRAWIHDAYY
jgi:hypothetical protein